MLLILALIGLSLLPQGQVQSVKGKIQPVPGVCAVFEQLYDEEGLRIEEFVGSWRVPGYGYILLFERERARVFCESSSGSWEITGEGVFDVEDLYVVREEVGDLRRLALHPLGTPRTIERLAELPKACLIETDWAPTRLFEVFAATMTEYYPFFEERSLDWHAKLAAARKSVNDEMGEKELFDAICSTLEGLGDRHVSFEAEINGEGFEYEAPGPLISRRIDGMIEDGLGQQQREAEDMRLFTLMFDSFKKGVQDRILGGQGHSRMQHYTWGRVDDEVGYILITGMVGDGIGTLAKQIETIHAAFDAIITDLKGVQALVIDITVNGGGMDVVSHAIASHFADKPRLVYSKEPGGLPGLRHTIQLAPWSGARFTGPIFLVSSDMTASAAEIFQLCMKAQPHVTLVGTQSSSAFSDVVHKPLPNGWYLGMSVEAYRDPNGVCYEAVGVPRDVEIPVFEGEDLHTTHVQAIEVVLDLARKSY